MGAMEAADTEGADGRGMFGSGCGGATLSNAALIMSSLLPTMESAAAASSSSSLLSPLVKCSASAPNNLRHWGLLKLGRADASEVMVANQSSKMTLYCSVMVPVRRFRMSGTVLACWLLVPM
jgi:hypothetical protein